MRRLSIAALALAGVAAGGAVLIRRRFGILAVVGVSMEPTFRSGDRVLYRRTKQIRPGQVVVLSTAALERTVPAAAGTAARSPGLMIKRVAAMGGEAWPDRVYGERREGSRSSTAIATPTVAEGHVVVLGDNPRSLDSRVWGQVPQAVIRGVVIRALTAGN